METGEFCAASESGVRRMFSQTSKPADMQYTYSSKPAGMQYMYILHTF